MPNECLNCGAGLSGAYCSTCGQKQTTAGFTLRAIFADWVSSVLFLESKLIRTIVRMLRAPGLMPLEFVSGKRVGYLGPVQFLIICVTLYLLCIHFFGSAFNPFFSKIGVSGSKVPANEIAREAFAYVIANTNYLVFLLPPVYAFYYWMIARKLAGFADLLILSFYLVSIGLLLQGLFVLLSNFHGSFLVLRFGVLWLFFPWAVVQFTHRRKVGMFVLAMVMSIIAHLSYMMIVAAITLVHLFLSGRFAGL